MSEDRYTQLLGDYVDGTLSEEDRGLLESHLAVCESCRTLAADLLHIKRAAGSLPWLTPPANVWKQIHRELRAREPRSRRTFLSVWASPWALAASLLLVAAAAGAYLWWGASSKQTTAENPVELAGYVTSELQLAEEHYVNAITGLEKIISQESQDQPLDPQVMAIINDNLDLIEHAIGESRAAAVRDPESQTARESLLDALKNKLNLLQSTILLINEVRKGRGESAYDLLHEMRDAQKPGDPI